MMIVNMRMQTELPKDEVDRLCREGFPKFKALEGLKQKYYIHNHENGDLGGVYFFETRKAAEDYVAGPIVATVAERFKVVGDVKIECVEVLYTLDD